MTDNTDKSPMQTQARLSGFELLEDPLEWNTSEWSESLVGRCVGHASVVLSADDPLPTMAIIGGYCRIAPHQDRNLPTSVFLLNFATKQCLRGPSLGVKRASLVAVVCNGRVYAIGGNTLVPTVECVSVSSLLNMEQTSPSVPQWEICKFRLSCPKVGCAAEVVHDRYIVVLGGSPFPSVPATSTVDILDAGGDNENYGTVTVGPRLQVPRSCFAATVIGNEIYVVGGMNLDNAAIATVESLSFPPEDKRADGEQFWSRASWQVQSDLELPSSRAYHAVCSVGSCLVVAGGLNSQYRRLNTVQAIDTKRRVVWKLPNLTTERIDFSLVSLSNSRLLVVGGWNTEHLIESLQFVELSLDELKRQMDESSPEFHQPNSSTEECSRTTHMTPGELVSNASKKLDRFWHTLVYYYLNQKQGLVNLIGYPGEGASQLQARFIQKETIEC